MVHKNERSRFLDVGKGLWMGGEQPVLQDRTDEEKYVMGLLISLLEEQTGEEYEYVSFTKAEKWSKIKSEKE